jgi:hypothetical protein
MGCFALDEALQIEGEICSSVKRMAVWLASLLPFGQSSQVLERIGQIGLCGMSIHRCVQEASEQVSNYVAPQPVRKTTHIDMGVSTDGFYVNVRKDTKEWTEMKVGTVFHVDNSDDDKEEEASQHHESVNEIHAVAQTYVSVLTQGKEGETPNRIGQKLQTEAEQRGWLSAQQTVVVADGASWIWGQAEQRFPDSAHIVDWYHAKQHLWEVAKLMDTRDDTHTVQWVDAQSDLLYHGKITELVAACKAHANPNVTLEDLDKKLNYFRNNHQRMQYADFQRAGLPIGSGVVESAAKQCKHRLAATGMRWSHDGIQRLAPFIDARLSNRLDSLLQHCFPF